MKKWILMSLILGAIPLSMMAQDDDMYFVPSKQAVAKAKAAMTASRGTYYIGSNRDVDEYNRQGSYYQPLPPDSDIIDFSAVQGVYPDSTSDYSITREMMRYDGYEPGNSFWEGYNAGRRDSWYSWTSPWYTSYYYNWYDPWYYPWYGTWYDPWYYGYYSPYYYRYGYYGYYGWGYPYYYGSYWYGGGGPGGRSYARNGGTSGTISRYGDSHGRFTGYRGSSGAASAASSGGRASSARSRTVAGHSTYNRSGSTSSSTYSNSGNFSGARSSSSYSSGSSSSSSSGGSFSGGGASRSSGGGGGGGGGGGIRSGGRR